MIIMIIKSHYDHDDQIRNPNGGAAVELSHKHLQRILAETSQPTSMVIWWLYDYWLRCFDDYDDNDEYDEYANQNPSWDKSTYQHGECIMINILIMMIMMNIMNMPTRILAETSQPTSIL